MTCKCNFEMPGTCPGPANCPMCQDEEEYGGYDMADPKHPTWAERMADHADYLRDCAKDERAEREIK